jgi:hypothetical protein
LEFGHQLILAVVKVFLGFARSTIYSLVADPSSPFYPFAEFLTRRSWTLTTLPEQRIKIGAKVVHHAKAVT